MRGLLAVLVVAVGLASAADARMHHPYRAHRIILAGTGVLDGFTQPAAAYSFRKLRTAYAGSALRLQRVDTTQQDIGFTAAGDFDTAAATAFCTTACTVVVWYDQSGAARNLVPTVVGPAYTANCIGALPCMRFTGSGTVLQGASLTPATGTASISVISRRFSGTTACVAFHEVLGANRVQHTGSAASYTLSGVGGTIVAAAADAAWHTAVGVIAGAGSYLGVDGVSTTGSVTGGTIAGVPGLGGASTTSCDSTEAVLWDNYALTAGEAAALAENQRNYWMPAPLDSFAAPSGAYSFRKLKSTYSGPAIRLRRASDNLEADIAFLGCTGFTGCPWDEAAAASHCAATTCYARWWYDQSGSVRDLGQSSGTATDQPVLVFNCKGALPCLQTTTATQTMFNAVNVTPATGIVSFMAVANRVTSGAPGCQWIAENGNQANNRLIGGGAVNQWFLGPGFLAAATDNVWHAAAAVSAGASSVLRIDGTETTGSSTGNTVADRVRLIGPAAVTCQWGEIGFWDNYQLTAGERAVLTANQKSFWGTP